MLSAITITFISSALGNESAPSDYPKMAVIQNEKVIERMNEMGVMLAGSTPEAFQAYIESETIRGKVVRVSKGSAN